MTLEELLNAAGGDFDAIDTGDLTTEQLKDMITQATGQAQPEPDDVQEQPTQSRNEKGQFTKPAADKPVDDAVDDEQTPTVYRREIDLGDGSGKQVFESDSWEGLIDKLTTAQTNATRKIREQQAQLKELQERKKVDEQADKDDEFILSQDILKNPTEAVKKAFRKATGVDITEIKSLSERVKTLTEAQNAQAEQDAQNRAASAFMEQHPEYVANQSNGARLTRAVNLLVAEAKHNGQQIDYAIALAKAYTDLAESGLLELKSKDATASADRATTGDGRGRIGRPEDVSPTQRQVRRSSSLSSRAQSSAAPKTTELSEDDLYSMPLEKLKALANGTR